MKLSSVPQFLSLTLLITACSSSPQQPSATSADSPSAEPLSSKQREIVQAIDEFLADPLGVDPAPIVRAMSENPDVLVVIDQRIVEVTDASIDEARRALITAGFIGRNMRAQILGGRKENMPVDGARGMIDVYLELKAKDDTVSSAKIDAYLEHERKSSLAGHIESLLK